MASRPVALAKSRTWRGVTTATGSPAAPRVLATRRSRPPVASSTIRGAALELAAQRGHPGRVIGHGPTRLRCIRPAHGDSEAGLGHIDPDKHGVLGIRTSFQGWWRPGAQPCAIRAWPWRRPADRAVAVAKAEERRESDAEWEAWNERRMQAEQRGEPFAEPPPSARRRAAEAAQQQ